MGQIVIIQLFVKVVTNECMTGGCPSCVVELIGIFMDGYEQINGINVSINSEIIRQW